MEPGDAVRRSGVVWLRDGGRERLVWHVWHDDAVWLVGGPGEQALGGVPALAVVDVVVRDPETRAHAGVLTCAVERVLPGTPAWDEGVPRLHAGRLNARDVDGQQARWAATCVVLRLVPLQP